jgi:hypothetical protein
MLFASTWRESETRSARGLGALLAAAVAGLSLAVLCAMFLWPQSGPAAASRVRRFDLETLPLRQPVFVERENVWLVRLGEADVVALSAVNPHFTACQIQWRADFRFGGAGISPQEDPGWFRDPCVGATFDLAGNRVFGPAPRNMDRYPVQIDEGLPGGSVVRILLDSENLIRGESPPAAIGTPVRP